MRKNLLGLDHAVLRVADLERAAADFDAMGFTISPRGHHTLGTQNHCVMFGFDYLELLWVPPGVARPFYAESESDAEQMTGLALKSPDIAGLHQAWAKAGLQPAPPVEFSRPVDTGEGRMLDARFRATSLPGSRTPGGRAFACQHLTPELVWRPGLSRHANQVTGLNKVVIVAADPAAVALEWARVFDVPRYPIPDGISVTTGAAPIVVLTPAGFARQLPGVPLPGEGDGGDPGRARFAALYLSCGDLRMGAAALQKGCVRPVPMPDGSLALSASQAHGVVVVLK